MHCVKHLAVTQCDAGVTFHACDPAPNDVKLSRLFDLAPARRLKRVRCKESIGVGRVLVLLRHRRQIDTKAIRVDEPDHSPAVEAIAVATVQAVRDADVVVGPTH